MSVFGLLKLHGKSRCIFHFISHVSYSFTRGLISLIASEKFWAIISSNIIFIQALLSSPFRGLIKWMLHLFILFFISPNLSFCICFAVSLYYIHSWIISSDPYFSFLILSSVVSKLLEHIYWGFNFGYCIFWLWGLFVSFSNLLGHFILFPFLHIFCF